MSPKPPSKPRPASAMATPAALLAKHKLAPKKSWGQNFLHDPRIHALIVQEALRCTTQQGFNRVVEIGVGLGSLTHGLLQAGLEVWGIERDRDLCQVITQEFQHTPAFALHEADAVAFDYASAQDPSGKKPTIVGNLPYQLTGPLLFALLETHEHTGSWIVMVQKEVGERLCAQPGSKAYGGITVAIGRLRQVSWVCDVGPGAFLPPPKVDSAVLCIHPRETPVAKLQRPQAFLRMVRAAFQQRRKTLRNGLGAFAGKARIEAWCEQLGIDPGARAETLTVQQFCQLAQCYEASQDPDEDPRDA